MKSLFRKIIHLPVYIHTLAIVGLFLVAVYLTLKFFDFHTNHNQAVFVPDVRGIQIEDAIPFLEQNMLRYTIIDSIYTKDYMPGAIVELIPEAKSKVKKNRFIYITINAKTEEMATIPDLQDISFRQAYASLKLLRFKEVDYKYVPGQYNNLTLGVEWDGNLVESGTRVPLSATITLILSDGNIEALKTDSIDERQNTGDEIWF